MAGDSGRQLGADAKHLLTAPGRVEVARSLTDAELAHAEAEFGFTFAGPPEYHREVAASVLEWYEAAQSRWVEFGPLNRCGPHAMT